MTKYDNYCNSLKKLKVEYFKVATNGWSFVDDADLNAGAYFVSGCLDILDKLLYIIKDLRPNLSGQIDDILDRLHKERKLSKDYSELVYVLQDLESSIHYGHLIVTEREDKIGVEEIMGEMEELLTEMREIRLNE